MSRGRQLTLCAALTLLLLPAAACRAPQDMADQPSRDPYEPSTFFQDRMSARPIVAGTVARGTLNENEFETTGKIGNALADGYPFAIDEATLRRGRERYDIFCSPCHDRLGEGNGMIVQRGLRRPPSFHIDRLRNEKSGYYFDVMTNGFGAMPSYAAQINVRDRWAITAYIRALQISRSATPADVPPSQRAKLAEGASK